MNEFARHHSGGQNLGSRGWPGIDVMKEAASDSEGEDWEGHLLKERLIATVWWNAIPDDENRRGL